MRLCARIRTTRHIWTVWTTHLREDKLSPWVPDDQNISDGWPDKRIPRIRGADHCQYGIHRAVSVTKILVYNREHCKELPASKTAELLNELPADDRTDFLKNYQKPLSWPDQIIRPEERKITLSLLVSWRQCWFDDTDYVCMYLHNTGRSSRPAQTCKGSETIDVIYIIDESGLPIDDIRIRDVILASPEKRVDEIIDGRYVSLNVNDDQEHASQIFKMNNRVALPVIDDNNILLGIVTIDDMLWVANEEFSEDMQKMGDTEALNEPYLDIPLLKLFRKRIGWLVVLFLGEMLTTTAMDFADELSKHRVSLFVPSCRAVVTVVRRLYIDHTGHGRWRRGHCRLVARNAKRSVQRPHIRKHIRPDRFSACGHMAPVNDAWRDTWSLWPALDADRVHHWFFSYRRSVVGNACRFHVTHHPQKIRRRSRRIIRTICSNIGGCNRPGHLFQCCLNFP